MKGEDCREEGTLHRRADCVCAAPVPPARNSSDYVSVFSDAYTNIAGTDFNPYWGQSTLVSELAISGNPTKKYDQLNYQGIQLASVMNVSGMQYLHIDIWTPNCTSFDIYLINTTPSLLERKVTVAPVLNGWNSYDFPLSQFSPVVLSNITQFKMVGIPSGSTVVYWDNLYCWKQSSIATPTVTVTQPTCTVATGTITVTSSTSGLSFSIDGINYTNTTGVFTGLSSGTYNVTARNTSGTVSSPATATVNPQPQAPAIITAITGVRNINQCDTTQIYSVPSNPGSTFTWSVSGTGNRILSGQGTNTVVMVMKAAGTISVGAANLCGSTPVVTLSVTKAVPGTPASMTYSSTNVCLYTQSAFAITGAKDTFRIRSIANATGYIWEVPGGASMQVINDTTIAVVFPDTITLSTASPRYIRGYSRSACDTSLARSITLTRTVAGTPGVIYQSFNPNSTSGPAAVTNVCYLVGGGSESYMIRKISTAISYNWTLKNGSKAVITHLNAPGANDTAIRITYLTGFTKDTLTIVSVSGCGVSAARTLVVSAVTFPPTPSSITSSTGSYNFCFGSSATFTAVVPAPSATQTPASVYRWTKPNNTIITGASADSLSITLLINSGYMGGAVTVKGQTACGITGTSKSQTITHTGCATGTKLSPKEVADATGLALSVFPNPNNGQFHISRKYDNLLTENVKILLLSASGLLIESFDARVVAGKLDADIVNRNLLPGVYMVKISGKDFQECSRVLIR